MQEYKPAFFSAQNASRSRSAEVIVPMLIDLIGPGSVVDVGCGTGGWLSAFKTHHVDDVVGVDGGWVPENMLRIPKSCFLARDLTKPFDLERTFDLALSLEVAEHLDKEFAKSFVATLVNLSPVVVFSAAVPYQGGTHHVNEEWPDYWAGLFEEKGYVAIDALREKVWNNVEVDWFYAQNMLIFADQRILAINLKLQQSFERTKREQLSVVHPRKYLELNVAPGGANLKQVLRLLPGLIISALKRTFFPGRRPRNELTKDTPVPG